MTIHKCDRCGAECAPHRKVTYEAVSYDLCESCCKRFVDFMHMRDCSPEGVWSILVEHGQKDNRFHLGDTIMYSPSEVMEILKGESNDTGEIQ